MTTKTTAESPFIIWTLQRTGGTNLTKNLLAMSSFPATEHEPFNRPRKYGAVTQAWEADKDRAALLESIRNICAKRENIKHCVEMVPWRVSATLASASIEAGYKHLFLIRESSLQRLLSMEYARRTKVWGPSHAKPDEDTDPAFDTPLDIPALIKHENMGIERLNDFWKRLKRKGAQPVTISFEQVYETAHDEACQHVMRIVKHLGYDRTEADISEIVQTLREGGNQNTRDRYARFDGIEALQTALGSATPFALS